MLGGGRGAPPWYIAGLCWTWRVAALIHGVAPDAAQRYQGETFTCFKGSTSMPISAVNDDYCDCEDGSDEPGTSACTGLGAPAESSWFYCPNSGGTPRFVYKSRVGDGICDCCDGSDEWQHSLIVCRDTCEEQGRARKLRLEQRRHEVQNGIAKRQQALASLSGQADGALQEVKALDEAALKLEAEASTLEALQREKRAAVRREAGTSGEVDHADASQGGISEYAKWMENDKAGTETDSSVSEYAKWMETGDAGIKRVASARRDLVQIKVTSGALVDFVEFVYSSGPSLVVGEGKGEPQEPFLLQQGEALAEIRGGQGGLLDRIQFITDSGRESKVYGGQGGDPFSVKASVGKMIVGLERSAGVAGKITAVKECESRPLTAAEKELHEVSAKLEDVRQRMRDNTAKLKEVKEKIADVDGPHAAYKLITGCGEGYIGEYSYKICPFGEAKQGSTRLGNWKRWDEDVEHVGIFEGGERCFSGIVRSVRVEFECGESIKVESVREPSQCVYEASVAHPAACDPKAFESQGGRVLKPHEMHLEL